MKTRRIALGLALVASLTGPWPAPASGHHKYAHEVLHSTASTPRVSRLFAPGEHAGVVASTSVRRTSRDRALELIRRTVAEAGSASATLSAANRPPNRIAAEWDPRRRRAGHLLRRAGFGPNPSDMTDVLVMGELAWLEQQLAPDDIDDSAAEALLPPVPDDIDEQQELRGYYFWPQLWYARMVYSKRQLQEKTTLFWHEHFSVNVSKAGYPRLLRNHEETLRELCFGNFGDILAAMTVDPAMLYFLDNHANIGTDPANPPNENYSREFLQLFTMGTRRLNMDGTPYHGALSDENYTEQDVRELARALTGWYVDENFQTEYLDVWHDPGDKVLFAGTPWEATIEGRTGDFGQEELDDVIDAIFNHPSTAPFLAKELVVKFANESPSPGYVERVAQTLVDSEFDMEAALRAVFTDQEFWAPQSFRTMHRNPIELFVGGARALEARTAGGSFFNLTTSTNYLVHSPPSVFSFYRPGRKSSLITASLGVSRDVGAAYLAYSLTDENEYAPYDTVWDAAGTIRRYRLTTRDKAIDFLAHRLLEDDLNPTVRAVIRAYMGRRVNTANLQGAAWLILTSPDGQVN